jgi:arylformamidase
MTYDPSYLDAQYNNRLRVPQFMEHFKRWQALSLQARAEQACKLNIPYTSNAKKDSSQTLDIFPSQGKKQPVLVFIHGGYWRSLDKSDHSFIAPAFTRAGACVVIPNYGLCPAVSIEQIVLQQVQALVWVYRNIAQYGGDPSRISIVGHSAGGHLAAMMLACEWQRVAADLPQHVVRNALSLSGLHDLIPMLHTPMLQADLQLDEAQAIRCSPALMSRPSGQLIALCGGDESDEFIRQNQLIATAWGKRCVPVCEALPSLNHFSILEALIEPKHRAHALALNLLTK